MVGQREGAAMLLCIGVLACVNVRVSLCYMVMGMLGKVWGRPTLIYEPSSHADSWMRVRRLIL